MTNIKINKSKLQTLKFPTHFSQETAKAPEIKGFLLYQYYKSSGIKPT
ncbi:hypothetical protein CFB3_35350 [Clostridium folliculivorans]|uniref:Uncharacterized protein n=1 Tax=Clostridium folliculivorans TaxID=2886038 RepID=A0A9W6DC07_9CLOT|nr:hypothetical protein CFOLD11_36610 [Clostridium folliculivorans]GKU31428.1 hypothetical protein CFB3_35350 [Clostridium folliculivorans]